MTIPELIDQLKKIVPSEKFNWEVFITKIIFTESNYQVNMKFRD
jgi:hypothetical protein